MQENWIGRSEGARVLFALDGRDDAARGLHHPARHALRRLVLALVAQPSAGRRSSRADDPALADFIAECNRMGTSEAVIETAEKRGYRHRRSRRVHPLDPDRRAAGLCRQFRADGIRHRRDLRLPGARPARPRFRPQIRPAGHPGGAAAGRRPGELRDRRRGLCRGRHAVQFRFPRRARRSPEAKRAVGERLEALGPASARSPIACATGACRASATGAARSRSSIARTAASCRCRRRICRSTLPEDVELRPAGQSARPSSDLEARRPARTAAARPSARPTRSTRSSNRPGISRASARRARRSRSSATRRRLLDAGRPVYRRHRACGAAPALFALLHPRADATAAISTSTSRSPACSPRAWCATRPIRTPTASGCSRRR